MPTNLAFTKEFRTCGLSRYEICIIYFAVNAYKVSAESSRMTQSKYFIKLNCDINNIKCFSTPTTDFSCIFC